jgi:hypothetical protein
LALDEALSRHHAITDPFSVTEKASPVKRSTAEVMAEVVSAFNSRVAHRKLLSSFGVRATKKKQAAASEPPPETKRFLLDVKEVSLAFAVALKRR